MRMRIGLWVALGAGLLSCVQVQDNGPAGSDGLSDEAPGLGAQDESCSSCSSFLPIVPCGDTAYPTCNGACEYNHQTCQAFPQNGAGGADDGQCLCAGAGPGVDLTEGCGDSFPECGGDCPAGQGCHMDLGGSSCICESFGPPMDPPLGNPPSGNPPISPPFGNPPIDPPPMDPPINPPGVPCGEAAHPACDGTCEYDHQSCQAFPQGAGAGGAGQGYCLCAGSGP